MSDNVLYLGSVLKCFIPWFGDIEAVIKRDSTLYFGKGWEPELYYLYAYFRRDKIIAKTLEDINEDFFHWEIIE